MHSLWPATDQALADDEALVRRYAPADRSLPWLRVNLVTSLDGAADFDGRSTALSGPTDKRIFGLLRAFCDALLVGAGTIRDEHYGPLDLGERRRAFRRGLGLADDPPLVVLSRGLTMDPDHPMFTAAPVRPIVITAASSSPARRAALAEVAEVIVAGDGTVDLAAALRALHDRGLRQILCEGGPQVLGALVEHDLVDEVCLTLSPLLAGGGPGRLSTGQPIPAPRRLRLCSVVTAEDVLLLRYTRLPG
ncbi:MAG: pyrimidine reductase family protein [Dactylosporangium sp.]|nr:pyrimidine reductase family protein [Dactylosporangium sp.]NNJ63879.1 pyrimidine reductase family protein [Dactylosporangium sp.]